MRHVRDSDETTTWGGSTQLPPVTELVVDGVAQRDQQNVASLSFHFIFTGEPSSTNTFSASCSSTMEHQYNHICHQIN